MKISKLLIAFALSLGLCGTMAAQNSENSAEDDFNNYDRGLIQTPIAKSSVRRKKTKKPKINYQPTKPGPPQNKQTAPLKTKPAELTQSSGLPGIKVWFERQEGCEGSFSSAAPTSVFTTGDCLRVRFETNFAGYLQIVNLGTSGNKNTIFPPKDWSDQIAARSKNYLPDEKGWEFTGDPGDEQLFFIVSNAPLNKKYLDDVDDKRSLTADVSSAVEVYDRDLTPRTENESVYMMADEKKLEKALVFRLTLKHR